MCKKRGCKRRGDLGQRGEMPHLKDEKRWKTRRVEEAEKPPGREIQLYLGKTKLVGRGCMRGNTGGPGKFLPAGIHIQQSGSLGRDRWLYKQAIPTKETWW